jgi:hypothetical protein
MRKIKQIDRPYQIMRTMGGETRLFSAETTLAVATARTDKLPKQQLPANVWLRVNGKWECVYDRREAKAAPTENAVVAAAQQLPLLERMELLLSREDLTFAECGLAEEWARTMREATAALAKAGA